MVIIVLSLLMGKPELGRREFLNLGETMGLECHF